MRQKGHPAKLGWRREAGNDALIAQTRHPGYQAWRSPENVLHGLPSGCESITLEDLPGPRGATVVCIDPPDAFSIWPAHKRGRGSWGRP